MSTQKVIPGASAETSALYELLVNKPVGTRVTYEEMTKLVRQDVANGARGKLHSALRKIRNQHRQEWGIVRGEGIVRLADDQIVDKSAATLKGARRRLGLTKRILSCAEYEKLSPEKRREHDAIVIGSRTAELFTGKVGQDKLKKELSQSGVLPETRKVLELFKD